MEMKQTLKSTQEKKNQHVKHEIDMVNGPIMGKMLLFAFPLMLSSKIGRAHV